MAYFALMDKRITSLIFFAFLSLSVLFGQEYKFSSQLLQHQQLPGYCTNPQEYNQFLKDVTSTLELYTLKDSTANELLVLVDINGSDVLWSTHVKGEVNTAYHKKLKKQLQKVAVPKTRAFPLTLLFLAKKGEGSEEAYSPELIFPNKERKSVFESKNAQEQFNTIQTWSTNELLPFVASYFGQQAKDKQGAYNLSLELKDVSKGKGSSYLTVCDSSNYYWRALLESKQHPFDVLLANTSLLLSQGKLESASNYLQLGLSMTEEKSFLHSLLSDINWKVETQLNASNEVIEEAYKMSEKGFAKEAEQHLNKNLAFNPYSAQTRYALAYLQTAEMERKNYAEDAISSAWIEASDSILISDPFYSMEYRAPTADLTYQMYRRLEIERLVEENQGKFSIENYRLLGEIAVDLNELSYAALVYWHLIQQSDNEAANQDLRWFVFCLQQLQVNQITEFFNSEISNEAKDLEKEVEQRKTESPYYKSYSSN